MKKPPGKRTSKEFIKLYEVISKVKFFFQFEINSVLRFTPILRKLKYIYFEDHEIVIRRGDIGTNFFVILEGQVSVWVPADYNEVLSEQEKG